jgi:hypothetical protein
MSDKLVEKLHAFHESLSEAERANYKLILGLAASGLSPNFKTPASPEKREAFATVGETLARLQPYSARITPNGIAYRGRPAFLTDEILNSLIAEAAELRARAIPYDEHFLGTGGPIANKFAVSPELCGLVQEHAGEVQPTGVASFLFYDREGQGIEPHIDTDIFSLNVILMLKHVGGGEQRSCLVVFPPGRDPERLDLEPGEMVILFAGSITHGREFVKQDEEVGILTFGFHPLGA